LDGHGPAAIVRRGHASMFSGILVGKDMKKYLFRRVAQAIGVVFAISLITFFILNIIPGNPVELMLGEFATPDTIARVTHEMGLDKPLGLQYLNWLKNMLHGDFGTSYFQRQPVLLLLSKAFVVTARLALMSYALALAIGITFGILAAVFQNRFLDKFLMTLSIAGISAPNFWIAIILQIFIGLRLRWLPISGVNSFAAYILPTIALGTRYAASISRITRTSMLEVTKQDYIRTARAKGLSRWSVTMGHAFRNALIPIVTVAGTDLSTIFTGSMLIETVFSIPGIGKLFLDCINNRDLPLVEGGVMYIATLCVFIYLVVDILYVFIDPRIRLGGENE
jgi:peptide/nickel transport system permease protein